MGFTDRGKDIREVGIIDAALEDVFIRFRRFSDGAVVRVCAGRLVQEECTCHQDMQPA